MLLTTLQPCEDGTAPSKVNALLICKPSMQRFLSPPIWYSEYSILPECINLCSPTYIFLVFVASTFFSFSFFNYVVEKTMKIHDVNF